MDIRTVCISKVPIDVGDTSENFGIAVSLGCFCSGIQTEIRFVFPMPELLLFYDALIEVALVHNFFEFARSLDWTVDSKFRRSTIVLKNTLNKQGDIENNQQRASLSCSDEENDDGDEKIDTMRMVRNAIRESTSRRYMCCNMYLYFIFLFLF